MNLLYRILWVENDFDWAESIEEEIKEYVENQGFVFYKTLIAKKEDSVHYNQYDLILMDLKLSSSPMGDELIQQVRQLGIYTNVVFYSANGIDTIREIGRKKNLEGVYYAGRNKKLFTQKVISVIDTTIKKAQDLNNLRGLVMAEVSELDAIMENIVIKYFNNPERMGVFHTKITQNREDSLHRNLEIEAPDTCNKNCKLIIRRLPIEKIASIIDSSQKSHSIHEMLQDLNIDNHLNVDNKSFKKNYDKEIIDVRNDLAHCESKIEKGREILCTRKGDVIFDTEDFKRIRANITKYNKLFNEILNEL